MPREGDVVYSIEVTQRICELVAEGYALTKICKMDNMPAHSVVWEWQKKYPSFAEAFIRARESRADVRFDRIDEYAEKLMDNEIGPDIARILIAKEQWMAAQDNNAKYGTKQRIEQVNTHLHAHVVSELSTGDLMKQLQQASNQHTLPLGIKMGDDNKLIIDATYTDETSKG